MLRQAEHCSKLDVLVKDIIVPRLKSFLRGYGSLRRCLQYAAENDESQANQETQQRDDLQKDGKEGCEPCGFHRLECLASSGRMHLYKSECFEHRVLLTPSQ